jgi:hypothetical protein
LNQFVIFSQGSSFLATTGLNDCNPFRIANGQPGKRQKGQARSFLEAESPRQSRRDCIIQPRVARNELPWVNKQNVSSTLQRVESIPQISFVKFQFIPPPERAKLVLKWTAVFG